MNHGSGGRPGKGGRQVTEDEAKLWRQLTHSIDRVKAKPRVAASHRGEGEAQTPAPAPSQPAGKRRSVPPPPAAPARPPAEPSPAEFDRRTLRQVAAGKVPIDGILDLHGMRQDEAHARLRAFLVSSQAKGHRMLLVITGKGAGAGRDGDGPGAAPRGVLRRSVPQWLEEPEFRSVVLNYAVAGVRHGGDGALYIRLRKAREA